MAAVKTYQRRRSFPTPRKFVSLKEKKTLMRSVGWGKNGQWGRRAAHAAAVKVIVSATFMLSLVGCGGLGLLPHESQVSSTNFQTYDQVASGLHRHRSGRDASFRSAEAGLRYGDHAECRNSLLSRRDRTLHAAQHHVVRSSGPAGAGLHRSAGPLLGLRVPSAAHRIAPHGQYLPRPVRLRAPDARYRLVGRSRSADAGRPRRLQADVRPPAHRRHARRRSSPWVRCRISATRPSTPRRGSSDVKLFMAREMQNHSGDVLSASTKFGCGFCSRTFPGTHCGGSHGDLREAADRAMTAFFLVERIRIDAMPSARPTAASCTIPLSRRQHHHHLAAFHLRPLLHLGEGLGVLRMRLSSSMPRCWCAISRPRKRSVTLTLSPSSKKRRIARIFTS